MKQTIRSWLLPVILGSTATVLVMAGLFALGCAVSPPTTAPMFAKVRGTSMVPAYRPGAVVFVMPTPFSSLQAGNVVIYRSHWPMQSLLVCHRLVKQLPNGNWVVRGDANSSRDDNLVTPENYVGRVVEPAPQSPARG